MGFHLKARVRFPRLVAFEAITADGKGVILVRGSLLGPTWPSLAWILENRNIEFKIVESGGFWLVMQLDDQAKQLLPRVSNLARGNLQQEVYLPGVGFLPSALKKRFDFRILFAPALILVITLLIAILQPANLEAPTETPEAEVAISCALDLASHEFENWLELSIFQAQDTSEDLLVLQTELGLLNLKLKSLLGSTQLFSGYLECQDGRSQNLNFRADSSAKGNLVQLGEKLDP